MRESKYSVEDKKRFVAEVEYIRDTKGISYVEACKEAKVDKSNFYFWRKELKGETQAPAKIGPKPKKKRAQLLELPMPEQTPAPASAPMMLVIGKQSDVMGVMSKFSSYFGV